MGLPARKQQAAPRPAQRLRLVPKPGKKRRSSASLEARARQTFVTFASVVVVVSVLAIGRVWVTVQATEISRASNELRDSIKSERYEGDMLEVRQSALGSPSRIQAIAGKAMNMAPASKVTYLDLTSTARNNAQSPSKSAGKHVSRAAVTPADSGMRQLVAAVMDLTAGEAQLLLVGDVGVASTR